MKKSTRILAILMTFALLFSSFSVVGSAYEPYKGSGMNNSSKYNDVNAPVYSTNQYASMALDEVDRMLAKENMTAYVYIGTIDLRSVDNTLASVYELISTVPTAVLGLLGDAQLLKDPLLKLKGYSRGMAKSSEGDDADLQIIYALLNLLGDLAPVIEKYAAQTLDVGVLNGMIEEYMFDITELLLGLLYDMTREGKDAKFDPMDDLDQLPAKYSSKNKNTNNAAMSLLQTLLNEAILGEWTKLDDLFLEKKEGGKFVNIKQPQTEDEKFREVRYSHYNFDNKYGETAPDTATYDYYGWVRPANKSYMVTVSLGDCIRVKAGDPAPAPSYSAVDLNGGKPGYDFIEDLMRQAYNGLLIPLLNRDTIPWLRKLCGVEYDKTKSNLYVYDAELKKSVINESYDPTYTGEPYDMATLEETNIYAKMFNFEAKVPYADFTNMNGTFVDNFNDILGKFIEAIFKNNIPVPNSELTAKWTWKYSDNVDGDPNGNSYLFANICSVARVVLAITGDKFFPSYFKTAAAHDVLAMSDQQVVAYVLRGILNGSVDWMYIDETCQTVADVCYSAVEQLAWQDIPQYTYTKPTNNGNLAEYNEAIVDKCLDILLDVAVYNLNQDIDMNPTVKSTNPIKGEGLLKYQGDTGSYENNVLQIAAWAFDEYAPLLALDLKCGKTGGSTGGLTIDDFWTDFDTIINAIIPIKADSNPWISANIAGQTHVAKSFIFDNIVYPVLSLDATNFAEIFKRNPNGAFATMTGIPIIISLLEGVFDLLFPNVFKNGAEDFAAILDNTMLGNMVGDLLKILGTNKFNGKTNGVEIQGRGREIAKVALPVVCMILDLNEDQKFKELENYMPSVLSLKDGNPEFLVYNGSSGVNTSYVAKDGTFTLDSLYSYEIVSANVIVHYSDGSTAQTVGVSGLNSGKNLAGGESAKVTLSNVQVGQLIELKITYKVKVEDGSYLGGGAELTNTSYCYIAEAGKEKDDDSIEVKLDVADNRTIRYESEIYVKSGKSLASSVNGHSIRVVDNNVNEKTDDSEITKVSAKVTGVSNSNTAWPFAMLREIPNDSTGDNEISVSMNGKGGTYFLNPFAIAQTTNEAGEQVDYKRVEPEYKKDEEGKYILDDEGNRIPDGDNGGVPTGKYTMTATVNVGGTNKSVPVNVHIYNDYNLESIVDRAISANRQRGDYESGAAVNTLWDNYTAALNKAAFLALKPKNGATFENDIVNGKNAGFENLYEQYATALSDAIEALDEHAVSAGVESIERALAAVNGGTDFTRVEYKENGNTYYYKEFIEYDDPDYPFFSMRDFVPHTFNAYRTARNRANNLINSQRFYINTPLDEDYTEDELIAFDESVKAYDENEANKGAISSIEATYAIHMLQLTGGRLIRVVADKSKLQKAIDMCIGANSGVNAGGASYYSAKTWEAYERACAFAQRVNAMDAGSATDPTDLKPSMVNEAMSNLIESWKRLVQGSDYTQLDAAIASAEEIFENPNDPSENTQYTADSYTAFYNAYTAAVNMDRNLARSDENAAKIDAAAAALNKAINGLEYDTSGGDESSTWSLLTDCDYSTEGQLHYYSPWIDSEEILFGEVDAPYIEEYDDYVTGLIFGIPEDGVEGVETIIDVDAAPENFEFDFVESENGYGTGSLIVITDTDTDEISIYMIVLRGDIDGDGTIDGTDQGMIYDFYSGEDWEYDDTLKQNYYGADTDFDGSVDMVDYSNYYDYFSSSADISQIEDGELIYAE